MLIQRHPLPWSITTAPSCVLSHPDPGLALLSSSPKVQASNFPVLAAESLFLSLFFSCFHLEDP